MTTKNIKHNSNTSNNNRVFQDPNQEAKFANLETFDHILRIARSLSSNDKQDFLELIGVVLSDESDEEKGAALEAIIEILEDVPHKIVPLELEKKDDTPSLQKWLDFVAGNIKHARKTAGLSQIQLSEKAGIPQGYISRLENAQHHPNHKTLQKIAKACNIPISQLDPAIDD